MPSLQVSCFVLFSCSHSSARGSHIHVFYLSLDCLGCDMLELRNGSIGPWRADIDGSGCVGWDKTAEGTDWLLNMARVCSMMGLILGCILTFFGFFKQCLCPLPCSQIIMDISGVALQISLALVWPMIRSDVCQVRELTISMLLLHTY